MQEENPGLVAAGLCVNYARPSVEILYSGFPTISCRPVLVLPYDNNAIRTSQRHISWANRML